ncbi:MAG: acetate kinase [Leptothrix sp. (in: Bacteria)]|nr:acetate kinase [Leptothrix sp. (in: b-proteobacteria)]
MSEAVLVINAGSATLKFSVHGMDELTGELVRRCSGLAEYSPERARLQVVDGAGQNMVERPIRVSGTSGAASDSLAAVMNWLEEQGSALAWGAVGHRVVHGGARHASPVRIDAAVMADLERLVPLAPLHQPHNLAAVRAVAELRPDVPQVACFDTAFHCAQAPVAQMYALPRRYWHEGIRAYGFHGLSYEYIAGVLPTYLGAQAGGKIVVAHLGGGASLCALRDGRSVASTMGFTALDGLVMGTRCGSLDPGVVLHLMAEHKMDVPAIQELLYRQSGLLGVSGLSGDMRTLLASDAPEAAEAVNLFVYRIQRHLGSLVAALEGLDALVFTGGIGENAASIRERICRRLEWLGLRLDKDANDRGGPCISLPDGRVSAWVIPTDEDAVIARHTLANLRKAPSG